MKKVSIQDLKATLSATIAEAEAGATILITRHGDPVAAVGPARAAGLHRGRLVGRARLSSAIRGARPIPYRQVLDDDRGER